MIQAWSPIRIDQRIDDRKEVTTMAKKPPMASSTVSAGAKRLPSKQQGGTPGQVNDVSTFMKRVCSCGCGEKIPTGKLYIVRSITFSDGRAHDTMVSFIKGHEGKR
jgi:hypothetical protein